MVYIFWHEKCLYCIARSFDKYVKELSHIKKYKNHNKSNSKKEGFKRMTMHSGFWECTIFKLFFE